MAIENTWNGLWHSNAAHCGTGYGDQTRLFTPLLHKDFGLKICAYYGREGAPAINHWGITEFPRLREPYGNDVIDAYYRIEKANWVLSLLDPFVLDAKVWQELNWLAWVPIDSVNLSPVMASILKVPKRIWAMSKFGMEQMKKAGLHNVDYVPHGVDTDVYKPVDRTAARQALTERLSKVYGEEINFDDKFLVVTVAANKGTPSRKNFATMFKAFAAFAAKRQDAVWYIHTDKTGTWDGEILDVYVKKYGLEGRVFFPDVIGVLAGFLNQEFLNNVYNAGDVFYLLSYGEGFGIPIMEAQAAGCPVIVTDGSAMAEISLTGWEVPAIPIQGLDPARMGVEYALALMPAAVDILNKAYKYLKSSEGASLREMTRGEALEFDYRAVYENYMKPAFEKFQKISEREAKALEPITIKARTKPADVSVIITNYNKKDTVKRAVDSVLSQDVSTQIILVDDMSDDGSWKYLKSLYKDDQRITLIRTPKGAGPVGALNFGAEKVSGRYTIKLDADDWFEDGALAAMVKALDDNPDVGFVYGRCQYHGDMSHGYTPPPFVDTDFLGANMAIGEVMYRSTAHTKHQLQNRGFWERDGRKFGPHDWDFVLQMIFDLGWQGKALPKVKVLNYWHVNGTASTATKARNAEVMTRFRNLWPKVTAERV